MSEQPDDWFPSAMFFVALVIGFFILCAFAGCATQPAVVPVGDGLTPCTSTNAHPLPGACGQRSTAHYYCTVCLNDERCLSSKSVYCVARDLGCDDPVCR